MGRILLPGIIILCLLIQPVFPVYGGKLSDELSERLHFNKHNEYISVIVRMSEQTDLKVSTKGILGRNKAFRLKNVIKVLQANAATGQKDVIAFLEKEKAIGNVAHYSTFWIFNGFALKATPEVIEKIASRTDIEIVGEDLPLFPSVLLPSAPLQSDPFYTWNLKRIRAPDVWAMGYDGSGVVIGIFDTGVDYTHPDLSPRYRGGNNSWFDPFGEHDQPYDLSGHGTYNAGIILGGDAYGKHIGVAPGAQWIAARLFNDAGESYESDVHKCFQWFMDPDGDPETDDAPDIVNGSWGRTLFHLIPLCFPTYYDDIIAWHMAGIIPVFAAGNLGLPFPLFSGSIPATYPGVISVGATDVFDVISIFSSRGPSNCDLSVFPDITAPGTAIISSHLDHMYYFSSGTSAAAPHITGAIALMLNANPDLSVDEVESILKTTAKPLGFPHPNNTYGWGRVDALEAVKAALP